MSKIRGIYSYEDKKKMSKKDKKKLKLKKKTKEIKKLKKNDKKLRIMCNCNHLDARTGKTVFKKIEGDDGVKAYQCKICKGIIYNEKSLFEKSNLESAWNTFYSLFAIIRKSYPIDNEMHKNITNALFVCKRAITIAEKMENEEKDFKKKNKKKNKDNKKNKKNKNYTKRRINY